MKIKFLTVITGLFFTALMITSCLSDEKTEYDFSSNASISAFSIDNIETKYTEKVNGKDTTLTATVVGANYPFVIDQGQKLIFNIDSLPVGTDVSKVVVKITADTQGIFIVADEAGKDSLWTSTDSLNYEKPIRFKVMAESGVYGETYLTKVLVHKQVPDSLTWTNLSGNLDGAAIQAQKAISFGDKIYVFADQASQVALTTTSITDGRTWTALQPLAIPEKAEYSSVMVWGEYLYILAGNKPYRSTDGKTWSKVETTTALSQLVANIYSSNNKNNKLVGIDTNNHFIESTDGANWKVQKEVPQNFPVNHLSYTFYPLRHNSSIDRMLVMGNNNSKTDTTTVIWSQLSTETSWADYPTDGNFTYCPKLSNITMISYNKQLYAFGGEGKQNGKVLAPFSSIYGSIDEGVSWKPYIKNVLFPAEFSNLYEQANGNYSVVVDKNNFLWIMWSKTGQVWRGRINKLGFDKKS